MPNDDLPIEHIAREPLPWRREGNKTQCGLPVEGHPVISRDEFNAKIKRQGQQRAGLTTCQTCYSTARTYAHTWEENPSTVMAREVGGWGYGDKKRKINDELRALSVLAQRHPEEFSELLEDYALTVKLGAVREKRSQ